MPYCTTCGKPLPEGSAGCPACSGFDTGASMEPLVWNRKIPLITNGILIRDFFVAFMGLGFLIATVLVIITWQPDLYLGFFAVFFGLFLLCLLIMLALEWRYGGGLETIFIVSDEGVSHHAGRAMRSIHRGSAIGAAAGGSMAGSGAALIAASQEDNGLLWNDVKYVRVYRKLRFIELRSRYLINPVVLYCTEENFMPVLALVQKNIPGTVSIRMHP